MKKLRILLGGNESIKSTMESWGFDVTAVADGKQACSAIYIDRFDLCLLDWDLPKMTGLEACGWIRSVNLPAQPYVVLVTHRGKPEQIQRLIWPAPMTLSPALLTWKTCTFLCQPLRTRFPELALLSRI